MEASSSKTRGNCLPSDEFLQDLCNRYVLNAPEEERKSFERLLRLVESAHWYYVDNFVGKDLTLKEVDLKEFTKLLFNCCDALRPYVDHVDKVYEDFTSFKSEIPVAGAIILDETHERCLLVRECKGPSWSFPCGKKCKDEEDHACAIREVLEETGCDISYALNKKVYLELTKDEQRVRLYIVAGVSEERAFAPLKEGKISEIIWHPLDNLGALELFMVAPFIPQLKKWIANNPSPLARKPNQSLKELCVWSARLGGKRTTTVESYNRELDIKFGNLTFDQWQALARGRSVESNNTKPEVETVSTSRSRNRKPEMETTTSRRVRLFTPSSNSELLEDFSSYKPKIPVAGAIILDETHERCLLVRECKGPSWSFPCGKKCKDEEEDHACAIRKVLEETGCDIKYALNKKVYLELKKDEQRVRLYIVAGVSEERAFAPLKEGKISEITWHPLDNLGALESFMVTPFLPQLKKWIVKNPSPLARKPNQSLKELCVWSARLGGKRTKTDERYTRELDIKFGDLTLDQMRALERGRLVVSNNTKPEVETVSTSRSRNRKPEMETTTSRSRNTKPEMETTASRSRNTKPEPRIITFGNLTFDLYGLK